MINNKPRQQKINVDVNTLKSLLCPNCKCVIFQTNIATFKKLSSLQSPTGTEQLLTVQLIRCINCDSFFLINNNVLTPISAQNLSELDS